MILDLIIKNVDEDFLDGSFWNHLTILNRRYCDRNLYLKVLQYNSDVPEALFFMVEAGFCDSIEISQSKKALI
jgi:hypothetical protein